MNEMRTDKTNYTICNCKKVTYFDVENALHECKTFSDVEKTFEEVQKITSCTTTLYLG